MPPSGTFRQNVDWIDKVVFIIVELHERFRPGFFEVLYNATPKMNSILRYGKLLLLKNTSICLAGVRGYL